MAKPDGHRPPVESAPEARRSGASSTSRAPLAIRCHPRPVAPQARRPGVERATVWSTRSSAGRCCARCAAPGRSCRRRSAGSRPRPRDGSSGSWHPGHRVRPTRDPRAEQPGARAGARTTPSPSVQAAEARSSNQRVQLAERLPRPAGQAARVAGRLPAGEAPGGDERAARREGSSSPTLDAQAVEAGRRAARHRDRDRAGSGSRATRRRSRRSSPCSRRSVDQARACMRLRSGSSTTCTCAPASPACSSTCRSRSASRSRRARSSRGSRSPAGSRPRSAIAETQASDILLGQTASIDTRNGIIAGRCPASIRPRRTAPSPSTSRSRASCRAARAPTSRSTARSRSSGWPTCSTSAGPRSARQSIVGSSR